jgi:voltage-gated potassium channel
MAAFALQPHVADFLDVVMHDDDLDYRLEQIEVGPRPGFPGRTLEEADLHRSTGALLLALRTPGGVFLANPGPATLIEPGSILIVLGTPAQLAGARRLADAGQLVSNGPG